MACSGDPSSACRPLIVPIFIPHLGCPHRCIFCNQRAISGTQAMGVSADRIRREVHRFRTYTRRPRSFTQISFYGGNFLGLGDRDRRTALTAAQSFVDQGRADSIRFSTRPDSVCPTRLDQLSDYAVSTIELGVQSMIDRVLDIAERGHRQQDTVDAVRLLQQRGYRVGLQIMVGLPGDDDEGAMESARRVVALKPDFVRIYPTLVLKGSALARLFRSGRYRPLSLGTAVTLVKRMFSCFNAHQIPVVRMGLQADDGLTRTGECLAGPFHPAFGHLVHAEIVGDALVNALDGCQRLPAEVTIHTHPAMVSRVQGQNRKNLERLKKAFGFDRIVLVQDMTLARNHLVIADRRVVLP